MSYMTRYYTTTHGRYRDLAQRFFGDFLARTLRFFIDRELSNHVGGGHALAAIDASHTFTRELDAYAVDDPFQAWRESWQKK